MYKTGRECNWRRKGIKLKYREYEGMKKEQNNCCKICGTNEKELSFKLCVDHNHDTMEIRGLLCNPCNKLLGNVKDNISILKSAIEYLEKTTENAHI